MIFLFFILYKSNAHAMAVHAQDECCGSTLAATAAPTLGPGTPQLGLGLTWGEAGGTEELCLNLQPSRAGRVLLTKLECWAVGCQYRRCGEGIAGERSGLEAALWGNSRPRDAAETLAQQPCGPEAQCHPEKHGVCVHARASACV